MRVDAKVDGGGKRCRVTSGFGVPWCVSGCPRLRLLKISDGHEGKLCVSILRTHFAFF